MFIFIQLLIQPINFKELKKMSLVIPFEINRINLFKDDCKIFDENNFYKTSFRAFQNVLLVYHKGIVS